MNRSQCPEWLTAAVPALDPGGVGDRAGREIPGRAAAVRGTPSSVFLQPQLMDIFSGGSQLVCWAGPREGVICAWQRFGCREGGVAVLVVREAGAG